MRAQSEPAPEWPVCPISHSVGPTEARGKGQAMVVLEILGFSLAVMAICAGLFLFLIGGPNYRKQP